nr:hypothetical protein HK105_003343 [Polyrhizophydium stewartii]
MEFEFLSALDYNLHVSKEAYHTWCTQLERFLAIARKDAAQAQAQAQAQAHAHAKAQAKAAAIAAGYYTVQQPSAVAQAAAIAAAQQHAYQQQQQQFKYAQYAHSTAARPPSPVELPMATFGGFAQQCAMAVASDNRPP